MVYHRMLNIVPCLQEDLGAHSGGVLFGVCSLLGVWDRGWLSHFREEADLRGPGTLLSITDVMRGVE